MSSLAVGQQSPGRAFPSAPRGMGLFPFRRTLVCPLSSSWVLCAFTMAKESDVTGSSWRTVLLCWVWQSWHQRLGRGPLGEFPSFV